jgi:hypothetical protein
VAEVLADHLDLPVADLLPAIGLRWGILAEGLSERLARQCVAAYQATKLPVAMLAEELMFDPPQRVELREAEFQPAALACTIDRQIQCVPWDRLVFADVVRIQTATKEQGVDLVVRPNHSELGTGYSLVRKPVQRMGTRFSLSLDMVACEPWLWLRISMDRFRLLGSGLELQSNLKLNLYAMACEVALRAPQMSTGPGYRTPLEGTSLKGQEALTEVAWRHRLRWRVSRLANGLK